MWKEASEVLFINESVFDQVYQSLIRCKYKIRRLEIVKSELIEMSRLFQRLPPMLSDGIFFIIETDMKNERSGESQLLMFRFDINVQSGTLNYCGFHVVTMIDSDYGK